MHMTASLVAPDKVITDNLYGPRQAKKCLRTCKTVQIQIIMCMPKVSSEPLLSIHSVVTNDSISSSEGSDQTAQMCRLIWAFAVCMCQKTSFCIVQPILSLH